MKQIKYLFFSFRVYFINYYSFKYASKYIFILIFTFTFFVSCGDDGSAPNIRLYSISNAFPIGLAFSSPTQSITSTEAYKKSKRIAVLATDIISSATYSTKVEAITDMFNGSNIVACNFNFKIHVSTENANCYGPIVYYNNQHPDGLETAGHLPAGDLGIWSSTEGSTTEACSASELNKKVQGVATLTDTMIMSTASLFCIAKVNAKALPAEGETLTLTNEVAAAFIANAIGLNVTLATITRGSSDSNGNPVYITTLKGATTTTAPTTTTTTTVTTNDVTIRLKHIPTSADNSSYKGKLSWKIGSKTPNVNCTQSDYSSEGETFAGSIAYEKVNSSTMKYKLMSAQFCGNPTHADAFASSNNWSIDPTKAFADNTREGGWVENFNYAVFSFNPSDSIGEYQYAWQAGNNDGATRVFNISLVKDTNDSTKTNGTAYFGFGPSINGDLNLGTISGMYCNWAGPGGKLSGAPIQALAQRQTITKSKSALLFSVVADNISYAPVNACQTSSGTFHYGLNDSYPATVVTAHTLVSTSTIAGVTPTPPVDVEL
ncbi:MAG: hypothetical protein HQK51_04315 [Oligoflexia bacterium]|nr:hypothetical protein [Oligoflexia bacterium]